MRLIDNILYLSTLDFEGFEIEASYVYVATSRNKSRHGVGSWRHISDPDDGSKVLVEFESVPAHTKSNIAQVVCIQNRVKEIKNITNYLSEIAKEQTTSENILRITRIINKAYREETKEFYLDNRLDTQKASELAKCIALMDVLAPIRTKAQIEALNLEGISTKADLLALAIKWLLKNEIKGLPTTYDRLSRKVNQYSKVSERNEGLIMIAGKSLSLKNNTNNQKLNDLVAKFILWIWLYHDDVNPKPGSIKLLPPQVHHVYELYRKSGKTVLNKDTSEITTIPELSLSSIKNVIYRHPILANTRHGNKWMNDKFRPYVEGKLPHYSLSMFSMDDMDTSYNLMHKGRQITLKLYIVYDVATGYVVAWELAPVYRHKDDTPMKSLIHKVTSKAVFNIGYRLPLEWQMEKSATLEFKNRLLDNFENIATSDYVGKIKVKDYQHSSQSKFAEGYNGRFQNEVERLRPGFRGQGIITRKADSRPNPDIATKFFTNDQLIKMYAELFEEWNSNPVSKKDNTPRYQAFKEKQNQEALQMTERKYATTFGRWTFQTIGNHKGGQRGFVKPAFNTIDYSYEVPNYWELLGKVTNQGRVRVVQNPYDTAKCWLFEYDKDDKENLHKDKFLCECLAAEQAQRSSAESTEADGEILGHYLKQQDKFDEFVQTEQADIKNIDAIDLVEENYETVLKGPYNKSKFDEATHNFTNKHNKRIDIYGGDASEDEVLPD